MAAKVDVAAEEDVTMLDAGAVDCPVDKGCDSDGEIDGFPPSFSKSSAISLRVSVRTSMSEIRGTGASTALRRLSTTLVAQLTSLAASPTRSVSPVIKLLSVMKIPYLFFFLFAFKQFGFGSGLTAKALKSFSVSSLVFLTLSTYCCLSSESVICLRFA